MKSVKNERGNASFYLIWMTFILGLMLILVMNIADVFLVNQQASIGAEQASIAATDVVFEAVRDAVDDYDDYLEEKFYLTAAIGEIFQIEWTLGYRINEKEQDLLHSGYSANEAAIEAVDSVVTSHLPGDDGKLKDFIIQEIGNKTPTIRSVVSSVISSNKGDTTNAKVTLFKEESGSFSVGSSFHVEVVSSKEFKGTEFQSFISSVEEDMKQVSLGPTIDFAKKLHYPVSTFYVH